MLGQFLAAVRFTERPSVLVLCAGQVTLLLSFVAMYTALGRSRCPSSSPRSVPPGVVGLRSPRGQSWRHSGGGAPQFWWIATSTIAEVPDSTDLRARRSASSSWP